ncbi:hypothetical protein RclHR1_00330041 [Rhizophagus clarus]|uniref:BTB domain-containing protein n=1 Tax=Rhizophagus clarus TaxID=94130 RepID=A0A2Z6RKN3_9GLOM|nr:hypothetical protein RclHR1_00330041 [Rhizophagus clarus]GES81714.1 hypothetical protein GLOIN_2v1636747 [Rhizophagus clarus]
MEAFEYYKGLLQGLSSMLEVADDHDVIIQVGENSNMMEFRAHSNILRARSRYFKNELSKLLPDLIIEKDNMIKIKQSNITPNVFKIILKYVYIGEVNLTNQLDIDILELLVASNELLLEELFEYVQDYLIENQTTWLQENLIRVFHRVFPLPNCKKLQDHCVESISADPQSFITSKDFLSLNKNILYDLLKRNDFLIEEDIAWDYLIKWGIEQTPGLGNENSDRIKWNDENYAALEETLSKFIPLIRFSEISSANFYDKVHPFKAVIPNQIYEEAFEFYMKGINKSTLPSRIGKISIDSEIIKPELAYIIVNWIEGKDAKAIRRKKDSQYKFNLLYRSSRDGLDINTFRDKCKHHGPCLILIETSHTCDDIDDSWNVQSNRINNNRRSPRMDTISDKDGWGPSPSCTDNGGWGPNYNGGWDSADNGGWGPNYNGDWDSVSNDGWGSNSYWGMDESNLDSAISLWQTPDPPRQKVNLAKIYGEYQSHALLESGWRCAIENFIFSFTNNDDIKNMKICRMNYDEMKINYGNEFSFSNTFRMKGIGIKVNNSEYNDKNVINSNIKMFVPKKIEVFQVGSTK